MAKHSIALHDSCCGERKKNSLSVKGEMFLGERQCKDASPASHPLVGPSPLFCRTTVWGRRDVGWWADWDTPPVWFVVPPIGVSVLDVTHRQTKTTQSDLSRLL